MVLFRKESRCFSQSSIFVITVAKVLLFSVTTKFQCAWRGCFLQLIVLWWRKLNFTPRYLMSWYRTFHTVSSPKTWGSRAFHMVAFAVWFFRMSREEMLSRISACITSFYIMAGMLFTASLSYTAANRWFHLQFLSQPYGWRKGWIDNFRIWRYTSWERSTCICWLISLR